MFLKFSQYLQKTPVLESFFNKLSRGLAVELRKDISVI